MAGQWHSWGIWLHMPANNIGYELPGWPMASLRQLATCAHNEKWVRALWLTNGISREIGYLCLPREMGMSSVAGQWHSLGNWPHELASRILNELCGWPMAFLGKSAA